MRFYLGTHEAFWLRYVDVPLFWQQWSVASAALDVVARTFGIKRSRVITRMIENALARGILANLAHMPAPRIVPEPASAEAESEPEVAAP